MFHLSLNVLFVDNRLLADAGGVGKINQDKEVAMADYVRKHVARLTSEQRVELEAVVRSQKASALVAKRARILLLTDADHPEGRRTDSQIAELVGMTGKQVKRIRLKYVQQGLGTTLKRQTRSDAGVPKTMDGEVEGKLVTLCCSTPPEGRQRWTLQLLVDELCRLKVVAAVCRETVRKTLKKIASSRGNQNAFEFPKETAPDSWPTWRKFSTFTAKSTTKVIR